MWLLAESRIRKPFPGFFEISSNEFVNLKEGSEASRICFSNLLELLKYLFCRKNSLHVDNLDTVMMTNKVFKD